MVPVFVSEVMFVFAFDKSNGLFNVKLPLFDITHLFASPSTNGLLTPIDIVPALISVGLADVPIPVICAFRLKLVGVVPDVVVLSGSIVKLVTPEIALFAVKLPAYKCIVGILVIVWVVVKDVAR